MGPPYSKKREESDCETQSVGKLIILENGGVGKISNKMDKMRFEGCLETFQTFFSLHEAKIIL